MDRHKNSLLVRQMDQLARVTPGRLFAVIPRGLDVCAGFESLSIKRAAQAVDHLSWWLNATVLASRQRIAYLGGNDIRYCLFMLACHKTGHYPFFPSSRNSIEAQTYLFENVDSSTLIYTPDKEETARKVQDRLCSLKIIAAPEIDELLNSNSPTYLTTLSYSDVEGDIACIIHTSGTTGMPKPVMLTHAFFATVSMWDKLQWPENRQPTMFFNLKQPVLSTTPFFHIMGLISFIISIFYDTPVLYGPDKPLSVELLINIIRSAKPTAAAFPPSVLKELSSSTDGVECLKLLQSVHVGGAPLAPEVGNLVRKYTRVVSMIGSSEIGWIPSMIPASEDNWEYFEWNPSFQAHMNSIGDGVYELVIKKSERWEDIHGIFHTFRDIESYRTKDLYTRHPELPNLWKYYGRQDDMIVLSNGEKFNPTQAEKVIEGHPLVVSAMIVGQSRFHPCLLVEGILNGSNQQDFVGTIWPVLKAANQSLPGYAQIMKAMIGVARKPLKKSAKGTLLRKGAMKDHPEEI